MQTRRRYFSPLAITTIVAVLAVMTLPANAQQTSATLNGTVVDATGAVIPGAKINLKNEASGDMRNGVSNGDGYFTFAAIPPGRYTLNVSKDGFSSWEAKGVVLESADKRLVTGIILKPSTTNETITVEATAQLTPVDSGEVSTTIDEHILNNVAIVGQNAAEFVKIMPGMAFSGGTLNQSSYAAQDERTGTGPVGSFSANGQRLGALDITSDGAHIIDPGCNCGQAMNTNADMTSELKVMTSNFGADEAKGPVTISAIGKSGGSQFHGELYTYNRYFALDANDPLNGSFGNLPNGQPVAPKARTKYFYPGGNISGPIIKNKLFFFYGMEYYKQDVNNGVYEAAVPTLAMRNGDFTDTAYISALNGSGISTPATKGTNYTNGVVNPGAIDPNGQKLMNVYPLPNVDPRLVVNGQKLGWNYINAQTRFSNMLQERGRIDYNISDSMKLYVSYNHQHDNAVNSLDVLWTGNGQSWASPTTPYPSPIVESTTSHVVSANLTKVFSPTLTNELIFTYTYLNLPNQFQNPNKVNRAGLGLNYNLLFNHPNPDKLIFPEMTGWGDGVTNMLNTGFELSGGVYAKKTLPSVADNVFKVWGTHTTKFGFYWERTWNSQPGNAAVNGDTNFATWANNTSGNAYADMLTGTMAGYDEQNFDAVPAFRYMSAEFYATDSWKVSRRLTLDYGLRVSHLGPWVDTTGYGFGAWYPNLFNSNQGGTAGGVLFPGIEWNKAHSSTPLSGSASRIFFYNPRVGFAWDILGHGNTVLRGGYGMYHFHDEQNVQNGAYGVVRGSYDIGVGSQTFSSLSPSLLNNTKVAVPANVTALDPTDDQEPRSQTYSLTVSQRLPWKSVLEVAYVGSKSDYLSNYNNNFDKINDLPVGALFKPNSQCGGSVCAWSAQGNYSTAVQNAARPYVTTPNGTPGYGTGLKIIDHKMYSNYNSLQASWNKQVGHLTFLANYTYSKALGIRGENGSQTGDPTSLIHNYGTLPSNRTHIFNTAYVYELPTLGTGNRFVKGAANGWQISGIVQYQTGADLQAAISNSYNFGYSAYIPANTTFMGVNSGSSPVSANNQNILGTPDVTLMPVLTCNPRSGLKHNQYLNGACFASFATPGVQGAYIIPAGSGPGFFNTDLSVFKNFTFGKSENKKLQFRFSGYNFLNHPLNTFLQKDPNLTLAFDQTGKLTNPNFGVANSKTGHRILQGAVKFSF
ncbi:MAG TPA: carboxypeptidase-like regulatory domain-containing protein [Terriglobales bacterium]|nr:carboxypeptidase-like regulatory domain-containing protein [Terriglobales bacterium]